MTKFFEKRQVRSDRFVEQQARRAEPPRTQNRPTWIVAVMFLLMGVLPVLGMEPAPSDPLNRMSPQSSVLQFLDACHSHEYAKAAHYLDLRQMSPADRSKNGPVLAQQLEDLL